MSDPRKTLDWTKPLQTVGGAQVTTIEAFSSTYYPRKVFFGDGSYCIYTESGCFYAEGGPDDRDLINVPEPAEAVARDDLRERVEEHERRLDEFWKRVDKIEERLAAIEMAATCGTEPCGWSQNTRFFVWRWNANDVIWFDTDRPEATDKDGNTWTLDKVLDKSDPSNYWNELVLKNSPAQADVGEATAVEQPPFNVGQVVECVCAGVGNSITNGERYTVQSVRRGMADWMVSVQNDGWNYAHRFRAIPPNAERESEPTPGTTKNLADLIRKRLANEPELAQAVEANRYVCEMEQQLDTANDTITTLTRERDEARELLRREKSFNTCDVCTGINEPCVCCSDAGCPQEHRTSRGLVTGLRRMVRDLETQLTAHRAAAEAMDALESGEVIDLRSWTFTDSKKWLATNRNWLTGDYRSTPTAAILAAKAASGTNTGEKRWTSQQ